MSEFVQLFAAMSAKDVACRFCHAQVGAACRKSGMADRPDEYRATHPHRLRVVDFEAVASRLLILEALRVLAAEAMQ